MKNYTILFYDPFTELHKLFISSLIYELQQYNIHYEIINKIHLNPEINYDPNEYIIILFLNPQFLKSNNEAYTEFVKISKIFKYKIYYITEPLDYLIDIKVWQEFIKILKPFRLLTYSNENINKLKGLPILTFKLTPKFNDYIDISDYSIENLKKRDISKIVFMGNMNENREKYFKRYIDENLLLVKNNIWHMDEYQEIMEKNLFFINIHRRNNCKCLEYLRIVPLLANGCIILSEMANEKDMEEMRYYNIYFFEREELLEGYKRIVNESINNNFYNNCYDKVIKFRKEFRYSNNDIYKFFVNNI